MSHRKGTRSVRQTEDNTVESRFPDEILQTSGVIKQKCRDRDNVTYLIPWASCTLASERTRNPRILVGPVPYSYSNTSFHSPLIAWQLRLICLPGSLKFITMLCELSLLPLDGQL